MRALIPIVAVLVVACGPAAPAFEPEIPELPDVPLGLQANQLQVPDDNPMTPEKAALGWQLYYDARLSRDGSVSCASCHRPDAGFADPRRVSEGVDYKVGTRNSPTVINAALNASQFWDGRAASLEEQCLGPIQNPVEMASSLDLVVDTVSAIPGYRRQFRDVFGSEEVTADRIAKAVASFERVVLSGNAPFDRWLHGDEDDAMSESAIRGQELFRGKAGCSQCHLGNNFTDAAFDLYHNLGVGMDAEEPDPGRYEVTGAEKDRGAFKTPTLRNVTETAPYMHDGSVATLEEVIELYDRGGEPNPWLSPKIRPLGLTDQEKADLLAFMEALTGEVPEWTRRVPPLPPGPDDGATTAPGDRP